MYLNLSTWTWKLLNLNWQFEIFVRAGPASRREPFSASTDFSLVLEDFSSTSDNYPSCLGPESLWRGGWSNLIYMHCKWLLEKTHRRGRCSKDLIGHLSHIIALIGSIHWAIPLLSISASDLITPRGKVNIGCIKKVTGDLNYTIITLPGHYSLSMAGSDGQPAPSLIMTTLPG